MENPTLLVQFEAGLAQTEALAAQNPGSESEFSSVLAQLKHVVAALQQGKNPIDPDRPFNFGFLGMRVIIDYDAECAFMLSELNGILEETYPS